MYPKSPEVKMAVVPRADRNPKPPDTRGAVVVQGRGRAEATRVGRVEVTRAVVDSKLNEVRW